jgi:hypothetical protein
MAAAMPANRTKTKPENSARARTAVSSDFKKVFMGGSLVSYPILVTGYRIQQFRRPDENSTRRPR